MQYRCKTSFTSGGGINYTEGDIISSTEYSTLTISEQRNFEPWSERKESSDQPLSETIPHRNDQDIENQPVQDTLAANISEELANEGLSSFGQGGQGFDGGGASGSYDSPNSSSSDSSSSSSDSGSTSSSGDSGGGGGE